MIKKTERRLLGLILFFSVYAVAANPIGRLVTIAQSGATIASTNIQICLNALDSNHPLSCQNFTITQATIAITPVATGQEYPHAGIRVAPSSTGFTFQTNGGGCTPYGDYCLFTMSNTSPKTVNANSTSLAIGQAKGGGVVACSTATGGADNLIATIADDSTGIVWSQTQNESVSGGTTDTDGATNTANMVAQNSTAPGAGVLCNSLTTGGFTDWFLPAKDQLNCLFTNKTAIGGFANAFYWSSTEFDADDARDQNFSDGNQVTGVKFDDDNVRCVRAF